MGIKVKTSKHCKDAKEQKKKKKRNQRNESILISNHQKQTLRELKMCRYKNKKKKKTWRDYLYLYDGKESLAQLHFECMRAFKLQLIEKCVDDEYDRMNIVKQAKNASNQNTKQQIVKNTKLKTPKIEKSKLLSEDCSKNKKEKKIKMDPLKTPQSPQNSVPSKIINIPYPSTMSSNPLPFNLPQISFSAAASKQHYASSPAMIKNQMPQYEHLTVSQPITASYPSQQISYNQTWYNQQQYMPLYATPTIHGYQYHHTLTPQSTAYYHATPSALKSNSSNAIYPQLIATNKSIASSKDKFPSLIPNFDISKASQQQKQPMYCDTVSSLSNTSNISNASCISSSHSITSILSKPEKTKTSIKMFKNANKKELISQNGQWIIRQHLSGSARTEGIYSLAPSNKGNKK